MTLFDRLHLALIEHVQPHLLSLGFKFTGKSSKKRFKQIWIRQNGDTLDAIRFGWDKYNRPYFCVFFRKFDNKNDILSCLSDPSEVAPEIFGVTLYRKPRSNYCFSINFIKSLIGLSQFEIDRLVADLLVGLTEVSEFLNGGPPTDRMKDSYLWRDLRLPDNPPPWPDVDPACYYHMPPRRVGKGNKLTSWE